MPAPQPAHCTGQSPGCTAKPHSYTATSSVNHRTCVPASGRVQHHLPKASNANSNIRQTAHPAHLHQPVVGVQHRPRLAAAALRG